jgi:excisionase family DNA binding protein
MMTNDKLYDIEEVCAYLKISRRSLYRYLQAKAISHIRPNGRASRSSKVFFTKEQLDAFLKNRESRSLYDLIKEIHEVVVGGK